MTHPKSILAVLLLTVIVGIVPLANAVPLSVEVTIAGSSAWRTLALAAYRAAGTGASHWTSAPNAIKLIDTRFTPPIIDNGTLWIVWNAPASHPTKVWSFIQVDSGEAGNRCYFAQPQCAVVAPTTSLGPGSNLINIPLMWGVDSALPSNVIALFLGGTPVNVASTDLRPEDAQFVMCRANSALSAGSLGGLSSDGLDGLGYNPSNAAGVCPGAGFGSSSPHYTGIPVLSGYPGSTQKAQLSSFNIRGIDPVTSTPIPPFTVVNVGAAPVVFVASRFNTLANLTNANTQQLQQVFSGNDCDASAFNLAVGGINIFVDDPSQGSVAAEADVFRHPTIYPAVPPTGILGISQEANVGAPINNPLSGQAGTCLSGLGTRYRAIGQGEEIKSVLNSTSGIFPNAVDGIGYGTYGFGGGAIAVNPSYGYITLNDVDPIFASYGPQLFNGIGHDPGQPAVVGAPGILPDAVTTPCGAFPCPESAIWAGGLSYPNLRNGTYSAWSVLRLVSNGTALANAQHLVPLAQQIVVCDVPDYVPFLKVAGCGFADPGLQYLRSHYQQYDGAGTFIGGAAVNFGAGEAGGDMAGEIRPIGSSVTQHVQGNQGLQIRP
ncbi:MAG: hypothetical protein WAM89_00710 [Terriglobales bacterium]